MKAFVVFFIGLVICSNIHAQTKWQQKANYNIDVTLNDSLKTLEGTVELEYFNNSPDTLNFIWIHIWPNAFSNTHTAFSKQQIQNGKDDFYFADKSDLGYITQLDFQQNNTPVHFEYHPEHIDIVKIFLASPILPNTQSIIRTPFLVKLPYNFSRGGFVNNSFQITQWYPKVAMYDDNGWHPFPYLEIGEYFSNFGSYKVNITVPKDYVVAATGLLQNKDELEWLKKKKDTSFYPNPAPSEFKTLTYKQDSIIDFAWFADKAFIVDFDTAIIDDKTVEVWAYYHPNSSDIWSQAVDITKATLHFKSNLLGQYPYPIASVVESSLGFSGGMEYPTITNISASSELNTLRFLIKHEVGHNWFQAILASNERKYPWMDEGMNSYYDRRFMKQYEDSSNDLEDAIYRGLIKNKIDQPIQTASEDFSELNFGMIAYDKAAEWLQLIESTIGQKQFDSIMKQYYQDWKFSHPSPNDFKKYFESIPNFETEYYFGLLDKTGPIKSQSPKGLKAKFFYNSKVSQHNEIFFKPIFGFNHYDKFMLGLSLDNYKVPNPNFNFFIAPLYSFSTNQVNGLARVSYTARGRHYGEKVLAAVDFAKFSTKIGRDSNDHKIAQQVLKIAPSVRYVFPEKSAKSRIDQWIEIKTFLINEKNFEYHSTVNNEFFPDLGDSKQRYVNRFSFVRENHHAINPRRFEVQVMQGQEFVRWNTTFKGKFKLDELRRFDYRFNFSAFNYIGGYDIQKYINTRAFHPKLTASRGWEDLTYSEYFFGRNETEGIWSRQVFERDGYMKLRTDMFADLQGRSDEWIAAINLSSHLPKKIMPIPLFKVFLDIGTYSETWKSTNQQPNLFYVGGIQIDAEFFTVNIPFVYSKIFRDNLKSVPATKGVGKNISFSFNLQAFKTKKMLNWPNLL